MWQNPRMIRTALVSAALLMPATAAAGDMHLDATLGTEFPVSLGGAVSFEGPARLRARVGVGFMPGPYLDTINSLSTGFGWYDDVTASLISAALKNSVIIHPQLGWRPVKKLGFHFGAGYQVAALGGSLSTAELIEAVTGTELDIDTSDAQIEVLAKATDHMVTVNVGYEFVVAKRLVIDTGLGGAFTVGANSSLEADLGSGRGSDRLESAVQPLMDEGEVYLNDTLKSYVHAPMIRIAVGYRFF
jgi:hypothetical protein